MENNIATTPGRKWINVRTKPTPCPKCKKILSAATNDCGQIPAPGDPTICVYCKVVLKFDNSMDLVIMNKFSFNLLPKTLQANIKQMRQDLLNDEINYKDAPIK